MLPLLNTYLDNDYKLIAIHKNRVFVFEKDNNIHLSQIAKPSDDKNKNYIGINSLKEAVDIFKESSSLFNNIAYWDFVLSSQITEQSRIKFYEYLKEINTNNYKINFCGLKKLGDKL